MATFAEQLKNERRRIGASQSQLARMIGVHPLSISRWERGDSEPGIPAAILALLRGFPKLPKAERRFGTKGGRPRKGQGGGDA
jgi:transcriptional regulator with XRE-family HTH domain